MRKFKIHSYIGIAFLIAFFSCANGASISSAESQKIQNLRAFAKLHGYVKYFHPSDEASAIDWDKYTIYGAKQVKNAKDNEELKTTLEILFLPIAPTIQIYTSDQKPEDPMKHVPDDTTGLKIVAWQHLGVYLNTPSWYRSVRLNRKHKFSFHRLYATTVTQSVDATDYRGKEIRLRAFARANADYPGSLARLLLGIDVEDIRSEFDNYIPQQQIKSKEWRAYEIRGKVADNATKIVFGCFLQQMGQICVDDFKLFAKNESDEWQAIKIENPGFEKVNENNKPQGWTLKDSGYAYRIDSEEPYKGNKCLLIEDKSEIISGKLFEQHPKIGEVVNKPLGSGLFCQIPLALYSDENGTLGKNEKYQLPKLPEELEAVHIRKLKANEEDVRLANVIIAWNVFQHFYPYFDVVNVDWDSELTNTLQKAMTDKNEREFYYTLSRLIANLQDGHNRIFHKIQRERAYLPFSIDWIERQVVVIVPKYTTKVHKGDIIVSIDGTKAEQVLLDTEKYISGSPQHKRFRALRLFGYGSKGTKANLTIKRGSEIFQIHVERIRRGWIYEPKKMPKIDKIQDDIFYVDLTKAQWKEIKERIHDLAKAKGVIFDLRGGLDSGDAVINHLLREKDTSDAWIRTPQIIYPDLENIVGYKKQGWELEPREPRIKGKVVFLTDARAISYTESFMSFIEHYKLGEIVGQPTAGTNGAINRFNLPGGYTIRWTGMKVVKHDGSQHHLIGIQPTVPVQRTIQGVIEGRDEFLGKALEIINQQ